MMNANAHEGPAALSAALAWIESAGAEAVPQLDELIEQRERQLALLRGIREALVGPAPVTQKPRLKHSVMPKPRAGRSILPDPTLQTGEADREGGSDQPPTALPPAPKPRTVNRDSLERVARTLHAHGPLGPTRLSELSGVAQSTVYEAVKHPWFEKEQDGYHLSSACYAELIRKDG